VVELSLLSLRDVSSGYGKMRVLENLNLDVERGEIVSILGPNGSGKTTLLNTIFGLANIFSGEILFDGKNVVGMSPHEVASVGIAYAPQQQNVFPSFTVEENLALGAFLRKDNSVKADVDELFRLFPEIERRRRNLAKTLSGGERQMLAVARALMLRPRLLLLDEPTAGLSPKAAKALTSKFEEIRGRGITIILVEQNARMALEVSDVAYVLVGGRIVLRDSSSNLLSRKDFEQIYFR
jgi:branched-chain amino acid transport system ATP-binding protein